VPDLKHTYVDWDYDTFAITENNDFLFFDLEGEEPRYLVVNGSPWSGGGWFLPKICKRIQENPDELPIYRPFAKWTEQREKKLSCLIE